MCHFRNSSSPLLNTATVAFLPLHIAIPESMCSLIKSPMGKKSADHKDSVPLLLNPIIPFPPLLHTAFISFPNPQRNPAAVYANILSSRFSFRHGLPSGSHPSPSPPLCYVSKANHP